MKESEERMRWYHWPWWGWMKLELGLYRLLLGKKAYDRIGSDAIKLRRHREPVSEALGQMKKDQR